MNLTVANPGSLLIIRSWGEREREKKKEEEGKVVHVLN
jgi:hypothetical protein